MAQTSINLQTVSLSGSEKHNNRTVNVEQTLHYADPELSHKNESWTGQAISDRLNEIENFAEQKGGRKLRSDAKPIREAVVVIEDHHDMGDLKKLAEDIKQEHGIECFQIHIHKDEGRWIDLNGKTKVERKDNKWIDMAGNQVAKPGPESGLTWKPNNHAHMLFDVQHKQSKIVEKKYSKKKGAPVEIRKYDLIGKVRKVMDLDYSKLQTTTARSLGMERGTSKTITKSEHLDPIQFKRQEAEKQRLEAEAIVKELQKEAQFLEQKKNQAEREYSRASEEYQRACDEDSALEGQYLNEKEAIQARAGQCLTESYKDIQAVHRYTEEEISIAVQRLNEQIPKLETNIQLYQEQERKFESAIQQIHRSNEWFKYELLAKRVNDLAREEEGERIKEEEIALKGAMARQGASAAEIHRALERLREQRN